MRNGFLQILIAEVKLILNEKALCFKVQCKSVISAKFHELHALSSAVESTCQW